VFVFLNWHRISAALRARGVAASPEALAAAEPHAKLKLDAPDSVRSFDDTQRGWHYFNLVLELAGVAASEATSAALVELHAYHEQHNLWELVPGDVPPALARLRALAGTMVVVSNSNGRLHTMMERTGLDRFFDHMLDSQIEGVEKPDPRLFEIALARSGGRAERTLHVGDFYWIDVRGARAAGLQAALIDPLGLHPDADCPRVRSLGELADGLEHGRLGAC
jgi:HAD superfamily hydrolase (TIGR01549 family)